jgi:hypothetical protein
MKGRQLNVYLTPEDSHLLERHLRSLLDIVAFEWRSTESSVRQLPNMEIQEMGKPWLTIGLARPEDVPNLGLRQIESKDFRILDVLRSPAIEFSRCFFDGKILRRGRLYYIPKYFDGAHLVQKSGGFTEWAKDVFNAAKALLTRDSELESYIGLNAERLRSEGICNVLSK